MGVNSLAERELKDQKEMKNKLQVEQYLTKFPESEKHLGFENVRKQFIYFYFLGLKCLLY